MSKIGVRLPLVPVCLLAVTTTCPAQEKTNASQQQLEEIVVTATKREEFVREIPASIAAFQGGQLEEQAVTSQEELFRLVPGVNLQPAPIDTTRIIVRGIAPAPKGALNQTTQVMVGDVPFVDNYAPRSLPDPLPFDLRAVEVLKGPQGTIFGSGSLNGTVRYIYEPPQYGAFGARYLVDYTSIDKGDSDFTVAGMLNMPVGENFAVRVVGNTGTQPGYNDNLTLGKKDVNSRDQDAARILLGWRPNEQWEVNLNYSWEDSFRHGSSVSNNRDGRYENTNQRIEGFFKYRYSIGELNIRRHFEGFDLVSVTGLLSTDSSKEEDTTGSIVGDMDPALTGGYRQAARDPAVSTEALTQELRLVSSNDASPWRWVVGVNYSDQEARGSSVLENFSDTGISPLPPFFPLSFTDPFISLSWDMDIKELAAFGDVSRQFFDDRLEVSLGGRYYKLETGGVASNQGTLIQFTSGSPLVVNQGTLKEEDFNPKVSLTWRPTDSVMAYTTVSRGFRLGGVQSGWAGAAATESLPPFVKSDWLWNYEVGLRTEWLDNSLQTDVAAYHIDWKNAQYTHSDPGRGAFFTDNVGEVKGDGVEVAIRYLPVRGLSINLSSAWTDITTAVDFPVPGGTVPTGTQWPGSFKWQHAASVNYSTDVGSATLNGGVTYTFLDGGVSSLVNQLSNDIGYESVDLQLGMKLLDSAWMPEVSLVVQNLFNDTGLFGNLTDPSLTGAPYTYVTYIQPRTYVLRLSRSF